MAIKLLQSSEFDYPVVIDYLDEKGKFKENTVIFSFKRLDTDELTERQQTETQLFADCLIESGGDEEEAKKLFIAELHRSGKANLTTSDMADNLLEIVAGWKDVTDDEGLIEFDRDNLIRLLKAFPSAYNAIKAAFNEAHSPEGKRKNSSPLPKPGPTRKATT